MGMGTACNAELRRATRIACHVRLCTAGTIARGAVGTAGGFASASAANTSGAVGRTVAECGVATSNGGGISESRAATRGLLGGRECCSLSGSETVEGRQ